ncbi:PREDICTED: broad-complex core protein isoforms 1/2/3/4/5 isoform X2 [Acromyrmex echinatior]|uniref:broad-complex core protein isoforms 1/2/3/4/5 isoform X2 n=1 Tax=Acromyrmex echinatior TaxID=103372 RepID=UPI000580D527|nr:PREDICTED: broad-complex core protein isoforms 1/2/3/4/5 isoform X2 [Acromyrmex echinatior]
MVDTQHFCLRWNNYQSSITSAFENLRDDEDFVDVTLACDGKSLKAHRVVLSACSPYFRELLKSTPCKHPVIVLQDVAFSDLHALVEFIYHGEVNVHQRSLSSFLKTAEVLRVSGLTQQTDQTDRDELSHVRALAAGGNHLPFHEKSEETFPRGGSPTPVTPTPTTVQQLLRRAQIRRNERRTPDPHDESAKRPRVPSPPLNNNDATPTDFSMVKNNHLSTKVEGNGVHDENSLVEENIKCEPLELTGGNGGGNAGNEDSSDSGAAASDRPPASASSNEHEPEPEHTSAQNFLPESKLFTSTPGSFNFSMAALTTDHTPLSGLGHGLQTPDLAGTSQDQEVTEEDGGWQSATNIEYQRKVQESNQNTSANRYSETMVQSQPQELPIIDLLDNINDQMEIVLKSEPISPRMVDLESCLLSNHTLESHTDLDSTHEYRQDDLRDKQQPQTSGRFSNNDAPSRFNLPRLRSQNGIVQSLRAYYESDRKSTNRTYCNFCQKTFSRAWSLQRHLADTHFYVPQSLSCDQCGRSYKSRNSLVSHKSQYHARKDRKEQEAKCEVTY